MARRRITRKGVAHRNPFMEIRHSYADFGDHGKDYYVIHFGRRAGIVILRGDEVLLVRQYRFLPDDLSWELPGGTIDEGEELEVGAIRECFEETGIRCRGLKSLLVYYPGLDNVDNRTTIFHTRKFDIERKFSGNPTEVNEISWIPLARALEMVFKQEILDAMTVAGLLGYHAIKGSAAARRKTKA